MEAYIFKDANTFKGYLFPKEWYEVSPANCDDDDDDDDDDDEEEEEEEDGDDDDDDDNNYIMTGYFKLT